MQPKREKETKKKRKIKKKNVYFSIHSATLNGLNFNPSFDMNQKVII